MLASCRRRCTGTYPGSIAGKSASKASLRQAAAGDEGFLGSGDAEARFWPDDWLERLVPSAEEKRAQEAGGRTYNCPWAADAF